MTGQTALSALVALAFAVVHVLGPSLTFLRSTPRSAWLSLAGGVSVAYVFVHVLPELAASRSGSGSGSPRPAGPWARLRRTPT